MCRPGVTASWLTPHFAETGFEREGEVFALAHYALLGRCVVHDNLKDRKKARGMDLAVMSQALTSSAHLPVILGDRPATVNFWSKEPKAFAGPTVQLLRALGEAVVGRQ